MSAINSVYSIISQKAEMLPLYTILKLFANIIAVL